MTSDIVGCIKWIRANAMFLGVDPNKICLHGCSGGGYAVASTCSKLALANEGHLIKLAMISCASDPGFYI
jgi:carboxylesterase type B